MLVVSNEISAGRTVCLKNRSWERKNAKLFRAPVKPFNHHNWGAVARCLQLVNFLKGNTRSLAHQKSVPNFTLGRAWTFLNRRRCRVAVDSFTHHAVLQGIMGRVSTGTCDTTCLAGGQSLADQGLDPEDAVVMVAERAVAMRLDRWGREHGFSTPDLASIPSGTTSSAGTDDEDGSRSSTREGGMAASEGWYGESSRAWVGAGETAADVAEGDEFRLRLLEAVLGLYSNHPLNYGELEPRFHALSFFLCALPYYENRELKGLALKTLEVICVSFKVNSDQKFCLRE